MPAFNEERNVAGAVAGVTTALVEARAPYEIIVVNDSSNDQTGTIADRLAAEDSRVRVHHNDRNQGLGYNYWKGVELAKYDYVVMVPGDNEFPALAIGQLARSIGASDLVIPYFVNPWIRPAGRRVISRLFVMLVNGLFGLSIRYFNGPCVIRRELVLSTPNDTRGFAYMVGILVRLLRRGCSYCEVGVELQPRTGGKSKAFRPSNIVSVVRALFAIFWDVRFRNRAEYAHRPVRASVDALAAERIR